jgi:hypothetical protein
MGHPPVVTLLMLMIAMILALPANLVRVSLSIRRAASACRIRPVNGYANGSGNGTAFAPLCPW